MGSTRNQPRHQAKGIHGCGVKCMRVIDCVQPSRQKTQPLPYMFAKNSSCTVISAMANDQFLGNRNASKTPSGRHSQASTLMSQLGNMCPGSTPVAQYDSYRGKNSLLGICSFSLPEPVWLGRIRDHLLQHQQVIYRLSQHAIPC